MRQTDAVGERVLGGALEICVDREADVVACLRHLAELALARDPPEGVDEDAPLAAHTSEVGVVGGLDPGLPDAVARPVALVGLGLELLGADLADVAEDLGRQDALVVVAEVRLADLDAGKLALVLHQEGGLELVHRGVDRHRGQRVGLEPLVDLVADCGHLQPEELGQPAEHPLLLQSGDILERGGPDLHERPGLVGDEDVAVAVDDRAARCDDTEAANLVVVRVLEVALARDHLQRPEAEEERAEDDHGEHAEDRHAQGHLRTEAVRLLDPRVAREKPGPSGLVDAARQPDSPRGE